MNFDKLRKLLAPYNLWWTKPDGKWRNELPDIGLWFGNCIQEAEHRCDPQKASKFKWTKFLGTA